MKKGFTLIELLAVIVILSIIALISTPIIIGLIDNARKESFKSSAYGIVKSGEIFHSQDLLDGITEEVTFTYTDGEETSIPSGKKLEYNGTKPKSGEVKINSEGQIAIAIHNGNYCAEKRYKDSEITLSDKTEEDCKVPIPICKRAITLHTEECTQTSNYCYAAGYAENEEITYGSTSVTSGELKSGDAFDCDVNGDGEYNADTERFYYVSDLYKKTIGGIDEFDDTIAVLIYYTNTTYIDLDEVVNPDNTSTSLKAYNLNNKNYEGPITAQTNLPTTNQWINIELKSNSRQILTEIGTTATAGGAIQPFNYSVYAARLITAQEINSGCGIKVGSYVIGELNNCNYLMENTNYSLNSMGTNGYWLETPRASNSDDVLRVNVFFRNVDNFNANDAIVSGVRPAIEILKSDISY
jgi:type IV pilus assembly protein PilA